MSKLEGDKQCHAFCPHQAEWNRSYIFFFFCFVLEGIRRKISELASFYKPAKFFVLKKSSSRIGHSVDTVDLSIRSFNLGCLVLQGFSNKWTKLCSVILQFSTCIHLRIHAACASFLFPWSEAFVWNVTSWTSLSTTAEPPLKGHIFFKRFQGAKRKKKRDEFNVSQLIQYVAQNILVVKRGSSLVQNSDRKEEAQLY